MSSVFVTIKEEGNKEVIQLIVSCWSVSQEEEVVQKVVGRAQRGGRGDVFVEVVFVVDSCGGCFVFRFSERAAGAAAALCGLPEGSGGGLHCSFQRGSH